jgi:prephenate dehydrogenase
MRVADEGGEGPEAAATADLVVLAAPVLQNIAVLEPLAACLARGTLVTDVSSTKRAIVAAARPLADRLTFVGGHPLGGAAASGLEAARPDLFVDRPWILTPDAGTPPGAVERLEALAAATGGVPAMMDAAEHDRVLAYVSHLPQLAVSALMSVVGSRAGEGGLAMAGRGLRDTTRLATSPAETWRDIVRTNEDHVSAALDDLIAALERLRPSTNGTAHLDEVFRSAARWKGVLEHG